ncbi:hypothetical protein RI129_002352 [Pyrocoelia pectoralis]|uniref:Peptidase M12B domain-containing protein n=1 Tax=Pyrocoelia pectoralis TaxID=417401 RepID=A0AAN7VFV0_9COLE
MFITILSLIIVFTQFHNQTEGFFHNFHKHINWENIAELEIVYLPVLLFQEAFNGSENRVENNFNFTMFGRPIVLNLRSNEKLFSPYLKSYVYSNGNFEIMSYVPEKCHYIHRDELSTAAISSCEPNSVVQALYHHPSLGTKLDLVLVRIDIMKSQPGDLPHYEGERAKLLDSFCNYQNNLNPPSDNDPNHWDLGLYVSGLDFFEVDETGQGSTGTLGLSTVGGVCHLQYACVIAEMGATNIFGQPYPSAGFASVYISAHEIGHNLGMHHDGTRNSCPAEGYIMSPSRGVSGETQWSSCSAEVMTKLHNAKCLHDSSDIPNKALNHSIYKDMPGKIFTAKKQCEILLRDQDATVSSNQELSKICDSMECKTPHRGGSYFAGPALQGTECGKKKHCYGGECVSETLSQTVPISSRIKIFGSPQFNHQATLFHKKDRYHHSNMHISYGDEKVTTTLKHRLSTIDYASNQCKLFSKLLPFINLEDVGFQAAYDEANPSIACAIFCQKSDLTSYYSPRAELNNLGISPYFSDGTWCHKDSTNVDYFCRQHHCIPEVIPTRKMWPHD